MFDTLEIWCTESPIVKDPVLIGIKKHPKNSWESTSYILARWGEELDSFENLIKKAADSHRDKIITALKKIQSKATNALNQILNLDYKSIIELDIPSIILDSEFTN
jgi:hypothetical protein